jgi:hypothetical protein
LEVEGEPRGFAFRTVFPPSGDPVTPLAIGGVGLWLQVAPAAPSGPLAVRVGADGAPEDSRIELDLVDASDPAASPEAHLRLDAPRDRRFIAASVGPDQASNGGLGLAARVGDWAVDLPAGRIEGRRLVRARLLGEGRALLAEATRPVSLERRPTSSIVILGVPDEARKGSTLAVQALADTPISGVAAVDFFLGPPPPGGKLDLSTKLFPARQRAAGGPWTGSLTLPEAAGPAEVGVRFLSRAGLAGYGSASLRLLDSDPIRGGRVTGRVVEGERPQPGLAVDLLDSSGATVSTVTSGPGGRFAFESVRPGKYKARSAKGDSGTRAESDAFEVKPGGGVEIALELLL